jgi:hypothetical protein
MTTFYLFNFYAPSRKHILSSPLPSEREGVLVYVETIENTKQVLSRLNIS